MSEAQCSEYTARAIGPKKTERLTRQVLANSPEEAAQNFHFSDAPHGDDYAIKYSELLTGGGHQRVHFAKIEVVGHGEFITRVYHQGIYRKGGVRPPGQSGLTLEEVARALGWKDAPEELLTDWEGQDEEWR